MDGFYHKVSFLAHTLGFSRQREGAGGHSPSQHRLCFTAFVQEAVILPLLMAASPPSLLALCPAGSGGPRRVWGFLQGLGVPAGSGGPRRDSAQVMQALTQPGGTLLGMELGGGRESRRQETWEQRVSPRHCPVCLSCTVWAVGVSPEP